MRDDKKPQPSPTPNRRDDGEQRSWNPTNREPPPPAPTKKTS
jgi:hypothetical protein